MTRNIFIAAFSLLTACAAGDNKLKVNSPVSSEMPSDVASAIVSVSDVNCWVERGQFFIIGFCNNQADEWQKIWLRMSPLDVNGNLLTINNDSSAVFPTFSDAVPPRGRTAFFVGWPLSAFSGTPDSCLISGAGAVYKKPGAILIATEVGGVRVLQPASPSDTTKVEKAWLVGIVIDNPLAMEVQHPRLELLLFGTDNRLWLATVLNPENPMEAQTLSSEGKGAIMPNEKRRYSCTVFYDNLPQQLKDIKIGRAEFQIFEAREE